jgi:hypothetical protein
VTIPDELWPALGAILVAALNELRAQLRARQADRERAEERRRDQCSAPPRDC